MGNKLFTPITSSLQQTVTWLAHCGLAINIPGCLGSQAHPNLSPYIVNLIASPTTKTAKKNDSTKVLNNFISPDTIQATLERKNRIDATRTCIVQSGSSMSLDITGGMVIINAVKKSK
jgi:hypothetical protein